MLVEVVEGEGDVVEKLQVHTVVLLHGCFPGKVLIAHTADVNALTKTERRGEAASHSDGGEIEEARGAEFVVADLAHRCTELQVSEDAVLAEEGFVGNNPAGREGGEETEAAILGELFGTVVAHIHLGQVAVFVIVGIVGVVMAFMPDKKD